MIFGFSLQYIFPYSMCKTKKIFEYILCLKFWTWRGNELDTQTDEGSKFFVSFKKGIKREPINYTLPKREMVCVLKRKLEFEFLKEFLKIPPPIDRVHRKTVVPPIFVKNHFFIFTKFSQKRRIFSTVFRCALYRLAVEFFKNSFRNSNSDFRFNTQTISMCAIDSPHKKTSPGGGVVIFITIRLNL